MNTQAWRLDDGREVTVELRREEIEISSAGHSEFDPDWTFTDSHSHNHGGSHKTLQWVTAGWYWCETCRDRHEEGEWRCRKCGEVIQPGTRWRGDEVRALPGLIQGTVTVEGLGERFVFPLLSRDDFEAVSQGPASVKALAYKMLAEREAIDWSVSQ